MKRVLQNGAGSHLAQATHEVSPASRPPCEMKRVLQNGAGSHLAQATHGVSPVSRPPLR